MGTRTTRDEQKPMTPGDIARFFEEGYREIEILSDGTVREANGEADASVTRTLKTERTWY